MTDSNGHRRRAPFEGQLNKFTNLVKGWQYRWFILDVESGTLQYYLSAEDKYEACAGNKPARGTQRLAGAHVVPSEEDSQSFTLDFASGEVYKLRAGNVKERQMWVDRIRAVAQIHDKALHAMSAPSPPIRDYLPPTPPGCKSHLKENGEPSDALQNLSLSVMDAFGSVHDILHQSNLRHREVVKAIEKSPRALEDDFLLLKSASTSALLCLENALLMIQDYKENQTLQKQAPLKPKALSESRFSLHSPLSGSPRKKQSSLFNIPASTGVGENLSSSTNNNVTSSSSSTPVGGVAATSSPTRSTHSGGSMKETMKEKTGS